MSDPRPRDVIAGAEVPGHPGLYVLGCYDTRITLYSQQVRALNLAHALIDGHRVSAGTHAVVIGGGAGGIAMAAALALQGATKVYLFERGHELMPLQSGSRRRRLDPHIFGWPNPGSENEEAELPVLDWRSGPAVDVRDAILQEFGEIAIATRGRLEVHTSRRVTGLTPDGGSFRVAFKRDDGTPGQITVDTAVLAIGFGHEHERPIAGVRTNSYWQDGGVPDRDIRGRARPGVLVSGNGDGGLIDLVAAASRDFSHDALVRVITRRPGIARLFGPLAAVDRQARAADAAGLGFDFVAAYDPEIGPIADDLGLTDETAGRLSPGVRLHLQTCDPELLSARTATLNRLAVYLVRRACLRSTRESFDHIVCADLAPVSPGVGEDAPAYAFDCGGRRIDVDVVVVRRGPDRDRVRLPFADLLCDHAARHADWVRAFPDAAIAPALGDAARGHFERLARTQHLPSPVHRRAADAAGIAQRIKVALHGGLTRWTGDIAIADSARAWDRTGAPVALTIAATPAELGPLAHALGRLALHARGCTMRVDVAHWEPFLDAITVNSRNADELERPTLLAIDGSSDLRPESHAHVELARKLGEALDRRCLALIDEHVTGLVERGADPGHAADLEPAPDVAASMRATWADWQRAFDREPDLLARFLRLLVCAQDGAATVDEARTLVGPAKRKQLIRATAAALAVAAGWAGVLPHPDEPGNLTRATSTNGDMPTGPARTGHVCGADRIGGRPTPTEAAGHLWGTDFVVLPMLTSPVAVAIRAEERLDVVDGAEPTLASVGETVTLMLSLDPRFKAAVAAGADELARLLAEAERTHYAMLAGMIERGGDADANIEEAA